MKILLVTADARGHSLASSLANRYLAGAQAQGGTKVERADLVLEGFDPRMTEADLASYRGEGSLPEDVRREQLRIERADVLLLAFPTYWWSMPALMKGWIERVFTKGWAFETGSRFSGPLAGKVVRLIATGGAGPQAYEKQGYGGAMTTQIEHGVFNFCGVTAVETHLFLDVESGDQAARQRDLSAAHALGCALAARQRDKPRLAA